jgi:hypothetical protein
MNALLRVLLVLSLASPVFAQSRFQIDLISPARAELYVEGALQPGIDCIKAKLSVTSDASGVAILKAHFYSAEGKLIHTTPGPAGLPAVDRTVIPPPTSFQKGKRYEVFFPIPKELNAGADKWKRVIVVFGAGGEVAGKIYPKDDINKFDFPEKASLSPVPTR